MPASRKPDAILYQPRHKQGPDSVDRAQIVQDAFGPILGCPNVYSRDVIGVGILCLTSSDDASTSYLTSARTPRYEWVDQPDGTKWGYLLATGGAPKEVPVDPTP